MFWFFHNTEGRLDMHNDRKATRPVCTAAALCQKGQPSTLALSTDLQKPKTERMLRKQTNQVLLLKIFTELNASSLVLI